jgi:hypothetical protein
MRILIGVDEAGYGPQLGPLAVAATAWRVDGAKVVQAQSSGTGAGRLRGATTLARSAKPDVDLYKLLRKGVARSPVRCGKRVPIADSKALYKSGMGLGALERGVLAALALVRGSRVLPGGDVGEGWRWAATALELVVATGADEGNRRRAGAWHFDDELPLPVDADGAELERAAALLDGTCRASGVELVGVRARLVFPEEFNALCDQFGNKASALSHVTLALVRRLVDDLPLDPSAGGEEAPIVIYLDKHGGRNRYAALVQHHFDECWVQADVESRAESRYRWEHRGAAVEAVFRVGCEELLPTALASMTAKYHREVAMRGFNAFWAMHVPGLRPTAGYFGDWRRFNPVFDGVQRELGFEDRGLWGCR